jgi:hypothetical protein
MRLAPAVLALAFAIGAATARAERPPSDSEKAAILKGYGATVDASCFMVSVSSRDSSWATVAFAQPLPGETVKQFTDRCNPANGVAVMHNPGSGWTIVTEGSDFGLCPIHGVPDAIALDFKLCTKPGRTMLAHGNHLVYKPRALGRYTHLRWRHWGAAVATATGRYDGAPVRLKASRRRACGIHPTYLRVTAGSARPVTTACPA